MMVKKPESPEYKDYYSRHPERKETDDKMRGNLTTALEKHFEVDPLGAYFQSNVFATRHILGLPEMIEPGREGTPLWQTMKTDISKLSSEETTSRIKDYARFLGTTKVRVGYLKKEWVYTHYAHPYTPYAYGKPVDFGLQDFCDKCMVCAEACPSGAITKKERMVRRGVYRWQVDDKKCRSYWDHQGRPCAICQAACPWNFESTRFHDFTRNINEKLKWFRKPAVWGYKLFYERKKWDPDPLWAYKE